MSNLAEVLAWKFDNAEGIRTREDGQGGMEIFDWPEVLGPEPTSEQINTWTAEYDALDHKAIKAALLLERAIDATFLDGHWITLRAMFGAGTVTGVTILDTAIAANDRAAFDIFFRDKVKARL